MNAVTSQLAGLFAARHDKPNTSAPAFDGGIVLVAFALMAIGLIIVTSASMPVADRLNFGLRSLFQFVHKFQGTY